MKKFLLLTTVSIISANSAFALDKLYSPFVEKGEWEVEYFGSRSGDSDASKDNEQKHQLSVGYGVNDWWKTEIYTKFEKEAQDKTTFDAWEWENTFQLTERGKYAVDLGATLAYEYTPQSNRADHIESTLIFAKDVGKFFNLLNVTFEKDVGSGDKKSLEGKLLWSSRYNYSGYFQPGVEMSNDFGELDSAGGFNSQKHYVGPSLYGRVPLGVFTKSDALRYRAACLFGLTSPSSAVDAGLQLEYEIRF
ncbi:MAG: hypothetical protein WCJ33_08875 [Pseudomonadota bacterium]